MEDFFAELHQAGFCLDVARELLDRLPRDCGSCISAR